MRTVLLPILATMVLCCVTGCNQSSDSNQPTSMPEPAPLAITWKVLSNLGSSDSFTSELELINASSDTLANSGWALYFNFVRLIESASAPDQVQVTHINGDFFSLIPTASFPKLAPGERFSFSFSSSAWAIKESDAPSGFYLDLNYGAPGDPEIVEVSDVTIRPFLTRDQTSRMAGDNLEVPTPASIYAANRRVKELPEQDIPLILPSPASIEYLNGSVTIDQTTPIYYQEGLQTEAILLSQDLGTLLGADLSISNTFTDGAPGIYLKIGAVELPENLNGANEEAYQLRTLSGNQIQIEGTNPSGVFYGIQSLKALFSPEAYARTQDVLTIPSLRIVDLPRFSYRGMHVDVSRNFHPKETILDVLDLMAFYKLNTFHFHVTDDEGWRLEIPGLPELTTIGSKRGHTLDESDRLYPSHGSGPYTDRLPGSGYYTRDEFLEILRYATDRHIEVITEIDVPGHARAAIKAMDVRYNTLMAQNKKAEAEKYLLTHPEDTSDYLSVQMWNDNVIDVCMPSTYTFLEKVFDELAAMYKEAEAPLRIIHTGGDEVPHGVWLGSPACHEAGIQNMHDYFLSNMHELLKKHDVRLAGWEEIALSESPNGKAPNPVFKDAGFLPYVWNNVWGWGMEDMGYRMANAGYEVVLANATNLYLDMAYDKHPSEPGFYWASFVDTYKTYVFTPMDIYKSATADLMDNTINRRTQYANHARLNNTGRANILGIQGQLWSERAETRERLEYLLLPKMIGLAERAWAQQPEWATIEDDAIRDARISQAWNVFANQAGSRELPRLDYIHGGTAYRIPPPGAVIENGTLYANVAFPGLTIMYTSNNDPSFGRAVAYTSPIEINEKTLLRTISQNGRSSRTIVVDPAE